MGLQDLMRHDIDAVLFSGDPTGEVNYSRDATSKKVRAILKQSDQTIKNFRDGRWVASQYLEALVRASELEGFGDPVSGDIVVRNVGGSTEIYKVAPFNSEREWVWDDSANLVYRIRLVLVGPAK